MLTADKYVHHLVHVQITMSKSDLYDKIRAAIEKRNIDGDEEAVAMMTPAVVSEIGGVSAISAHITGFFKTEGSP